MKQVLSLALAGALCLGLCACGGTSAGTGDVPSSTTPDAVQESASLPQESQAPAAESLEIGGSIDNDSFRMTFDALELADEFSYDTSEYSSTSLYVEEGYKLLMLRGHFENKATGPISDSAFALTATVNDTYVVDGYDVRMNFLRSKSFEIDAYTDLDYVIYINIPEKLAGMFETATFTIGFNNDLSAPTTVWSSDGTGTVEVDNRYTLTSGLTSGQAQGGEGSGETAGEEETDAQTIAIGDMITTSDYEFTLTNVELTYEVLPPNTSGVYSSYSAESGKVYVHVEADVKNTMQRDIRIDELFQTSVLYDGKYPYSGFTVVNSGDNSFNWASNYVAATPLETCKAHGIVECPAEVDTSGKSIVVTLELGDTEYQYTLR